MLKNKKTFLPLAILWTCIITFLSLVSFTADVGSQIHVPYKDKYVHFAFYFIFVVFWASFINGKSNNSFTNSIILIFAIQYGVFMEICQGTFTTTRMPDIFDIYANSSGAIVGLIFITIVHKTKKTTQL